MRGIKTLSFQEKNGVAMGIMTNPMDALASLQTEIFNSIPLMPCKLYPELKMFIDQPNGNYRFTFVKIESKNRNCRQCFW